MNRCTHSTTVLVFFFFSCRDMNRTGEGRPEHLATVKRTFATAKQTLTSSDMNATFSAFENTRICSPLSGIRAFQTSLLAVRRLYSSQREHRSSWYKDRQE